MPQGERRETVLHGGEAPGDCSERGQRKFGLNEFPQGECREIVLRGGRKAGGQEIVLGGRMGSSGSKSCRRASAGRLFCVGEWGGGGILFWVGEGGVRARRISAGRASGDCSAWRMGGWGAAGDWSERAKGEFRLGDLPQGERREIVLRGGAGDGEAAEHCYERENGELGLEELPRGERRDTVLRGARGMGEVAGDCFEREHGEFGLEPLPHGERRDIVLRGGGEKGARQEIAFSGTRASLGSKSCRGASAGRLFCAGRRGDGGGGRRLVERHHVEFGLE